MAWSKRDNYLQTRGASEYNVMDSPGRWVPTPPAYSSAAEPHWREIRTDGTGQLRHVSCTTALQV